MPTIKQLSRIFSADDTLNRVQDQLASALNPILKNVQGDLTGPLESPSVVGLQGTPIANTTPTAGQALVYNGSQWAPGAGGGGGVTAVTATSPMASSGGTTPNLSMTQSGPAFDGWLSSVDWSTFNSKLGPGDPTVVLLMAGSGTAGSTSFPDTSYITAPLTAVGNTQVVASPSKFGAGSAHFDGNGDYITAPANAAYAMGTGDFTIEGWIYLNSYGGGGVLNLGGTILDTQNAGGDPFAIIVFNSTTGNIIAWRGGLVLSSTATVPLNTWTFFAVVRSAGTLTIYINGAVDSSVAFTSALTSTSMTIGTTIDGRAANTYLKFDGYMNDLRMSNVAKYTAAFTPPTSPFPVASPPHALPIGPAGGVLGYPGSTYPDPSGLAPTQNYNTYDHLIPIRQDNAYPTWLSPQQYDLFGVAYQAQFGIKGADGYNPGGVGLYSYGGGAVKCVGGTGASAHATASYGGAGYFEGGTGGVGATSINGGPGGDAFLRGGAGGAAGIGSNAGDDGIAYVGDTHTKRVEIGTASQYDYINGRTRLTPSATQTISAATDSFSPTTTYLPFDVSGGNHTLTSTPTIATTNVPAGTLVILMHVGASNHIRLTRGTTHALSLASANPQIDPGGSMGLIFNGTYWVESWHTVATTT